MHKFLIPILICMMNLNLFAQVPEWSKTNSHKKYPSSKYLLGIGISDDKTTAVELARADVAKQIQVKIESELEIIEQEISAGDQTSIKSEITSKTKSSISETIEGIEIKEIKAVKGKYYALAVLNKQHFSAGLEQEMDNIISETTKFIDAAREQASIGNIFNALDNYISAQNTIPEFFIKRALYTALSGTGYGNANEYSSAGILAETRALLAGINIKVISGDNQTTRAGTTLKEPLVARVFYVDKNRHEVGVKWYPVIVKYSNGETISKISSATDGTVKTNVVAAPTGATTQKGTIVFTLGFSNLPDVFRDDLSKIQTFFSYNIQESDLSFSVMVANNTGDELPDLTGLVTTWINANGFKTDPDAPLIINGTVSVSSEKIVDSPAGKQYFVEAEMLLTLTDKNSREQLAAITASGKGLALGSRDAAFQKALGKMKISKDKFAAFLQAANRSH
ncbi:MAG TPA: hypothetical protein DHW42_02080 [Candidatus Marinimicrobia bacterium]|nr:hypothetical protein [Candidatus Neomarinimicrobiota bacterium]